MRSMVVGDGGWVDRLRMERAGCGAPSTVLRTVPFPLPGRIQSPASAIWLR
jgi:hypothetical protein